MRTDYEQIPWRQRIILEHDPVQHFVLQLLPDFLVGGRIDEVDQFVRIRPEVEEFFAFVPSRRYGIAEVFGSQGLLPGMLHNRVTIRPLTQTANGGYLKADQ